MSESSDQTFVPCLQDGYVGDGTTTKDTTRTIYYTSSPGVRRPSSRHAHFLTYSSSLEDNFFDFGSRRQLPSSYYMFLESVQSSMRAESSKEFANSVKKTDHPRRSNSHIFSNNRTWIALYRFGYNVIKNWIKLIANEMFSSFLIIFQLLLYFVRFFIFICNSNYFFPENKIVYLITYKEILNSLYSLVIVLIS